MSAFSTHLDNESAKRYTFNKVIVVDEATKQMIVREIVDIWWPFGLTLTLISQWFGVAFQWFNEVMISPKAATKRPRLARFCLWLDGIITSAFVVPYALMDEIFGCPNLLYPWMRVVIMLAYLAVWGYIIKRMSEIRPPKLSKP